MSFLLDLAPKKEPKKPEIEVIRNSAGVVVGAEVKPKRKKPGPKFDRQDKTDIKTALIYYKSMWGKRGKSDGVVQMRIKRMDELLGRL